VLVELACGDDPDAWAALGFTVEAGAVRVGDVSVRFDDGPPGLHGWTLSGAGAASVDGIPTAWVPSAPPAAPGAFGLDHVVVFTDDLDRTVGELVAAGGDERRRAELRAPMSFVRLGPIIEVVQSGAPVRLWGIVAVLDDLAVLPSERVGAPRDAVQPGRQIVTARSQPGLETAIAFMTPRVRTR
jgi:hypothetical protein